MARDISYKTPNEDLMNEALKHYEEAANAVHHFNSDIPKAIIKFYTDNLQPVEPQEAKHPVYTLNCDKCKEPYYCADAFPEDQLCNKCFAKKYLKHHVEPKQTAEEILDLQQYVINLLYAAYNEGVKLHIPYNTTKFDNWVEEQIEILKEYASQSQQPKEISMTDELYLITSGLKALRVLKTMLKKANLEIGVQTADIMIAEFEDYLKLKRTV